MDLQTHSTLVFFVNGKKIEDLNVNPEWTLLQYLRTKLYLCGTKLGCGEGGCGACTVMVSKYDRNKNEIIHIPVNACLAPICAMHGLAITTIEGIGSTKTKLHPVQERIAKSHGSQCGFCTPGIVMSMYTLLRNKAVPKMEDLDVAFQGNLCRCTGYRPIIEGYRTFTEEWELAQQQNGYTNGINAQTNGNSKGINGINGNSCALGDKCCKVNNSSCNSFQDEEDGEALFKRKEFSPYDPSQEPIFPPELKLINKYETESLKFGSKELIWYRPSTMDDLLRIKLIHPDAKIVVGNTEIGVEVKFKKQVYPVIINPMLVKELTDITVVDNGIRIGSAVVLDEVEKIFKEIILKRDASETKIFKAVIKMLHYFASKQIRSVASIGGNIMTGSPISDLNPIWMAAKVQLKLRSLTGSRLVTLDEQFYPSYRKTILKENEVLEYIEVPFTHSTQYFYAYKQSRRRDDDIAIVNGAFNISLSHDKKITDIEMAFGGMSPTTISSKSCKKLLNMQWNESMLEKALEILLDDLPLQGNAPGGMIDYRRSLPLNFFFKTYLEINSSLQGVAKEDLSALRNFTYEPPSSSQFFEISTGSTDENPVGKPLVHMSAIKQATGEATYLDDIPSIDNELYLAFVYTSKAHAEITSVNTENALKTEGVIGYISADDIPQERNKLGPVHQDEELFITSLATAQYQLIGAIIAEDQTTAQKAARLVEVKYQEKSPIIVSIEDAIHHNSFFDVQRKIEVGDVDAIFKNTSNIVEGECRTGYQEHFYLETHGCLAIPKEGDELELFVSCQHHAEITDFVARILGVAQNKIVTRIKRIGGGFGGKQSRGVPIAAAASVAAKKYNRPVRIVLDRDEDMAMTGGRHPYLIRYKAAFDNSGKILALDSQVYANGGYSNDLSLEVLERAVYHVENCYKIDNLRVVGRICKTNLPTNTAFRGFGAPQAMFSAENMIRDVSEFLNIDHAEVASRNLYQEGDSTHYTQRIINCNLKRCFDECMEKSQYYKRKAEIEKYNSENRWKKRGITIVGTKYGVGFGVPFLEQSGCLVNIYTDGSILITHGGVEMGQGLNTKVIQIAAKVLGVPADIIHINECATDKVPNTSPTAASVGSDLNGMAVLKACEVLRDRLVPIREANPDASWPELIKTAYFSRVGLSALGHYATPDVHYDWSTNTGTPYNYYTFGAACTEVEIDCLTGDHKIIKTDIVMDLGNSLNPAIDIGQIEGAFMQGYGLFTMEEMLYSPSGQVYTRGPGAYKIPGFADIPTEFNVSLLKGASNPRAVYSSKAVGEPPLFLASSTLFAIREAIKAARQSNIPEENLNHRIRLDAPATAEKIRMLCQDKIISKVMKHGKNKSSWNVIP